MRIWRIGKPSKENEMSGTSTTDEQDMNQPSTMTAATMMIE